MCALDKLPSEFNTYKSKAVSVWFGIPPFRSLQIVANWNTLGAHEKVCRALQRNYATGRKRIIESDMKGMVRDCKNVEERSDVHL